MAIVPTDIPMTSALCAETIERLAKTYPAIRIQHLATTAFGRPIDAIVIGSGTRRVLYSAAHHANEWITTPVLLKFAEDYAAAIAENGEIFQKNAGELARETTIFMVPMVNPDGVDLVTGALTPDQEQYRRAQTIARGFPSIPFPEGWKANLNGVDLNLNYPAGWLMAREIKFRQGYTRPAPRDYVGRAPLTQIETQTMYDFTQRVSPELVLALHTQGEVIYYQYGDIYVPGAQELAQRFAQVSGYAVEDTPYNSSFAGYKDWFIQEYRRPGFTIEAGSGVNPLPIAQFDQIYQDVLGILVTAATG